MTPLTPESIHAFMKGQVEAWNAKDREAFLGWYRKMAPDALVIDYAGRTEDRNGWFVIEEMFDKHNARMHLEIVDTIINGTDVAVRHRNCLTGTDLVIDSIETYRFAPGRLSICYFLKPPVSDALDLQQFRGPA
ncbi:nuclear transport factor 2 family protein [Pseudomonas lopnurensis]|uniref:nuclear transport factor 2 family protein n=1 Tax=Pseudomonas lopnurensis TaxID=1477517 RepID=UPI0028ACB6E4|nr:nuclear transport factor 2 family protein [Pseudomonas lopnurensis]